MKVKLYCISDVHGAYDQMKKALDNAGFDPKDKNSWLISCGDHFDRYNQPEQVMDYLMSLDRKVLIRGNHETLLEDCLERGYPARHDWSNGTAQTIIDLDPNAEKFYNACNTVSHKVYPFLNSMVNYYESKNYIFVHAWIPLISKDNLPVYYTKDRHFEFNPDWRNAHYSDWEAARWGNPYDLAAKGFSPDKTVVFGHWHTSWPRCKYEGKPEFSKEADFSPYYGNGYIGIDGCVHYTGHVNCVVLEDELLT